MCRGRLSISLEIILISNLDYLKSYAVIVALSRNDCVITLHCGFFRKLNHPFLCRFSKKVHGNKENEKGSTRYTPPKPDTRYTHNYFRRKCSVKSDNAVKHKAHMQNQP